MTTVAVAAWLGCIAVTTVAVLHSDQITDWLDELLSGYDIKDTDDDEIPQGLDYLTARETFGPLMAVNPTPDDVPLSLHEAAVIHDLEAQFHSASP